MAEKVQLTAKTSEAKRVDQVMYLQRTIGNQAVQRIIKSGALQAKLRIGQPGLNMSGRLIGQLRL
jgi:hypothetical protein